MTWITVAVCHVCIFVHGCRSGFTFLTRHFALPSLLLHIAVPSPKSEADYSEFIAGCLDAHTDLIESALSHVFHVFDINGDGKISLKELSSILTSDGSLSIVLPEGKTVEEFMKDSWPNWGIKWNQEGLAFLSHWVSSCRNCPFPLQQLHRGD